MADPQTEPTMNLADDFAEGWRPEEGDKIVGKVVDLGRGWSDYKDGFYPIVTVHDEEQDKDIAIHCFQTVLERKMREFKPKVGERIGIEFQGKRPTKNGKNQVAVYIVKVQGRTVDPWDEAGQGRQATPTDEVVTEQPKTDDDLLF